MPTVTQGAAIPFAGREASCKRVVIAGGGVAGLEALLALRDVAGDRVELTLLCSEPEFVYRPMAIAEPFGRGRAERHRLAEIAADLEAELLPVALVEVDPVTGAVIASGGERLAYDALLVAVGAGSEPAFRRVLTWTPQSDGALFGGLLRDLDEGYTKRVAFVVPPGVAWTLPAYELALMTAWQARGTRRRAGHALHARGGAARAVRHPRERGGPPGSGPGRCPGRDGRVRHPGRADARPAHPQSRHPTA